MNMLLTLLLATALILPSLATQPKWITPPADLPSALYADWAHYVRWSEHELVGLVSRVPHINERLL
jgi:hypothetical protein